MSWNRIKRGLRKQYDDFSFFTKQTWRDFLRISQIDVYWFVTWISIYTSFILLDIFFPNFYGTNLIKYIGVFLCIIYARKKSPKDYALTLALILTFVADTILVWTPFELAGVTIFCFAQFAHTIRLTKTESKSIYYYGAAILVLYIFARSQGIDALYAVAGFYAVELLINAFLARRQYLKDRHNFRSRCAFYGFAAFLGCDICVGLRHLILDGLFPTDFLPLIAFMVWVFYYPSQVFLANSSTGEKTEKRPKIAKKSPIR